MILIIEISINSHLRFHTLSFIFIVVFVYHIIVAWINEVLIDWALWSTGCVYAEFADLL